MSTLDDDDDNNNLNENKNKNKGSNDTHFRLWTKHINIRQRTTGFWEKNKISYSTDILCMKRKKKKDHDSRPAPDPYNTNTNSAPTLQFFFELPHLNS